MAGSITTTPPIIELPPGSSPSSIAQGIQGPAGPSNVLSIGSVTNGGAAAATITGTTPAQVLNLTLPQGPTGATGNTGPAGATGISGTPTANQLATFSNSTTIQGVTITGLVKANGASAPAAAAAGTDYLAPPSGTALLKANSGGALANATAGTDYIAPPSGTALLKANSGGALANATAGTDYLAPPAGAALLKANSGGALANAAAGTDYLAPAAIGTTVQAFDAQLFSNIPVNSQSAAYTLVAADAQRQILHPSADTTARTWTIPANASVAFPVGTMITFVNQNAAGVITLAITTDTMRLAGPGTTGNRTLAANGMATADKITTTEWIISGTGLT
jgi:hypothetical protein